MTDYFCCECTSDLARATEKTAKTVEAEANAVQSAQAIQRSWAAAAYADGPIWEPNFDATKRREFWEWWLTEAVSKAWQAIP